MKNTQLLADDRGFTLVEAIIAVAVFSIGILSVYLVQTTAVRGNSTASGISTASSWAADRIEKIIALEYDDGAIADDGLGTLDTTTGTPAADGTVISDDGRYTIYWNVDDDDPMPNIKHVRIIVAMQERGVLRELSFDHYKALY